jgi:hypothetical protein
MYYHKSVISNFQYGIGKVKKIKIFTIATIALFANSSYSMEFLSPEGQEAYQRLKHAEIETDASSVLRHEFGHGIQSALGFEDSKRNFAVDYMENPFIKELLFSDFDRIRSEIKQRLSDVLKTFSQDEIESFRDSIINRFDPGPSPQTVEKKPMEITASIHDKNAFAEEVANILAVHCVSIIWLSVPEIYNIIGLIFEGKTLCINTLCDMKASFELGKSTRWTHLPGHLISYEERAEKDKRSSPMNKKTADFMNWYYDAYEYTTEKLNHPTPRALKALEILHGITLIR